MLGIKWEKFTHKIPSLKKADSAPSILEASMRQSFLTLSMCLKKPLKQDTASLKFHWLGF